MLNSNFYRAPLENCLCLKAVAHRNLTAVLESVFNKVAGLQACNFVKKRLQQRCNLVKFAKFLRILFFTEHLFTVTASVCFENLVKILVRNSSENPMLTGIYRELQCRPSRGNFSKLIKQYPQLFLLLLWAFWNFEIYYICAAFWIKRVNSCLTHCSKKMNNKLSQCFRK